ncbi:MAG: hypothetical protein JWR26_3819 [Pedosphaera sp.]|nr:hypothetical protein [Pedosphaera sp.]
MNHIDAKDSRDLKDGKDLKDAAGGLGGWMALCTTMEDCAKGGQGMETTCERGVRGSSIGLQRPLKARKGRKRPHISDAFIFSVGGQARPLGCRAGNGLEGVSSHRFMRSIDRPCPEETALARRKPDFLKFLYSFGVWCLVFAHSHHGDGEAAGRIGGWVFLGRRGEVALLRPGTGALRCKGGCLRTCPCTRPISGTHGLTRTNRDGEDACGPACGTRCARKWARRTGFPSLASQLPKSDVRFAKSNLSLPFVGWLAQMLLRGSGSAIPRAARGLGTIGSGCLIGRNYSTGKVLMRRAD